MFRKEVFDWILTNVTNNLQILTILDVVFSIIAL